MKQRIPILDALHAAGAGRRSAWRTSFCVLFMFCAFAAGACSDDDKSLADDPDPVVPEEPGTPEDPDNPDPGKTLREDAVPLFFDAAGASGIGLEAIDGEPNGYVLTIDAGEGSRCFVPTLGLDGQLENRNVKLTFEYRCAEPIAQFRLGFPDENAISYIGRIESDVDRFADGWAPFSASIAGDIETYGWGEAGDRLGFYLRPTTVGAPVTFEIRDIYLEEIPGTVEPDPDPSPANIYPLFFTPDREAYGTVETKYGIISAIDFTREGDEYHLVFVDEPGHGEHFFASDPMTKKLVLGADERVEVVFRYKAVRSFVVTFGLYPFSDPAVEWPDTWTTAENIPSSLDAGVDEEGWATYRHDLTEKISKYKWGANPGAGEPYQMRFRFRVPDGTNKACPEKEGLVEMDLKNVYLEVISKSTTPDPGTDPVPDHLGDYTLEWGDDANTNKDFE